MSLPLHSCDAAPWVPGPRVKRVVWALILLALADIGMALWIVFRAL